MKNVSHLRHFLLLFALSVASFTAGRAESPAETPATAQEELASPVSSPAQAEPEAPSAPVAPAEPVEPAKPDDAEKHAPAPADEPEDKTDEPDNEDQHEHRHHSSQERVSILGSSTLAEGESAQVVVSIIGSSTSAGYVRDAVVSVFGGSRVTGGRVRGDVVSVLGGSRVSGGAVGGSVVSVLGNTYVNEKVKGEVVSVLGSVELGPQAAVDGDIVCVGGQFKRHEDAVIRGEVHHVAFAGGLFDFGKLGAWFSECLAQGRLLAFDARVTWAWIFALAVLGFYALIALVAPAGVSACVETLEQRPGSSLLAALLTMLLTPVAYILLALTLAIAIGVVLIPLFSLGLLFASIFGKIVMLAWLGRRCTKLLGDGPLAHPVFGVLIGGGIVLLLYATPIVGIVSFKLLGILGLGVVVYTIILRSKAGSPPKPAVLVAPAGGRAAAAAVTYAPVTGPEVAPAPALVEQPVVAPPVISAAPPVISAATLPRAGFWIRLAAAVLDAVLVGIVFGLLDGVLGWFARLGGSFPLWFAVYHVVMWATKGTTIGGIICGLKVVRLDDRPPDWSVAVVRALGGFLSVAVAGLGFIWVAFDDERQSWHDKIAGTTIVRVPKGTALL